MVDQATRNVTCSLVAQSKFDLVTPTKKRELHAYGVSVSSSKRRRTGTPKFQSPVSDGLAHLIKEGVGSVLHTRKVQENGVVAELTKELNVAITKNGEIADRTSSIRSANAKVTNMKKSLNQQIEAYTRKVPAYTPTSISILTLISHL